MPTAQSQSPRMCTQENPTQRLSAIIHSFVYRNIKSIRYWRKNKWLMPDFLILIFYIKLLKNDRLVYANICSVSQKGFLGKNGWYFWKLFLNSDISCINTSFKNGIHILSQKEKKLWAIRLRKGLIFMLLTRDCYIINILWFHFIESTLIFRKKGTRYHWSRCMDVYCTAGNYSSQFNWLARCLLYLCADTQQSFQG